MNTMQIYTKMFPANECRSIDKVKVMISEKNNGYSMYAVVKENTTVVIGFMLVYSVTDFTLLDYMAVSVDHQSQGIGTKMIAYLKKEITAPNHLILLEIQKEVMGNSLDAKQRSRRIKFYNSCDAKILLDNYYMPSYNNTPEIMNLMAFPPLSSTTTDSSITKNKLKNYIAQIYHKVYGRNDSQELLQQNSELFIDDSDITYREYGEV